MRYDFQQFDDVMMSWQLYLAELGQSSDLAAE